MADSTTLDDVIPLRPNDFHILLALTRGQKHGYRIAKEVEDESGGRIRLEAGNLQRTIQKLIRTGLVETSSTVPSDHPGDVRRKYYVITGLGRRAVSADIERMRSLVESVDMLAGVPARGSGAR